CFVVTDMLKESCAIRATQDAEGYYTFSYDTKINAKDSDWLNESKASDAEWANVGIMFNFGNATTKNVLIDYIKVEKVTTTNLFQRSMLMTSRLNWLAYPLLVK
ncbi:MAG: hypothetical protein IJE43_09200, partial [Alphaproteobacteria bacterium]|nr:hypothetical protein [Alphaproteobacteria bacterium]